MMCSGIIKYKHIAYHAVNTATIERSAVRLISNSELPVDVNVSLCA